MKHPRIGQVVVLIAFCNAIAAGERIAWWRFDGDCTDAASQHHGSASKGITFVPGIKARRPTLMARASSASPATPA